MGVISSTSTYAIRAALYVAAADLAEGEFVSARRIAEALDVPQAFLGKVLHGLTQAGILTSLRGPTGGVALARPAAEITLSDIVCSAGDDGVFHECVLGLPECSETAPCPMHDTWREPRRRIELLFAKTTLAALVTDTARKNRQRGRLAAKLRI